MDVERGTVSLDGGLSPTAFAAMFEQTPSVRGRPQSLPAEQFDELVQGTAELARDSNSADDGGVRVEAEYLLIVARKRG